MLRPLSLRSSVRHWRDLSRLLGGIERCVEACARLDAHRAPSIEPPLQRGRSPLTKRVRLSERFDQRLARLAQRIDQEIDRVTAERLVEDLRAKIAKAAA